MTVGEILLLFIENERVVMLKKIIALLLILLCTTILFTSCSKDDTSSTVYEISEDGYSSYPETERSGYLVYENRLYECTDSRFDVNRINLDAFAGKITSTVPAAEVPAQNFESNCLDTNTELFLYHDGENVCVVAVIFSSYDENGDYVLLKEPYGIFFTPADRISHNNSVVG